MINEDSENRFGGDHEEVIQGSSAEQNADYKLDSTLVAQLTTRTAEPE